MKIIEKGIKYRVKVILILVMYVWLCGKLFIEEVWYVFILELFRSCFDL